MYLGNKSLFFGEKSMENLCQAATFEETIRLQISHQLGAAPLLVPLLEDLRVPDIVNHFCPNRSDVDTGTIVTGMVLNRLMAPKPLYRVESWMQETAIPHLLSTSADKFNDDRLGRALEQMSPHLQSMWTQIITVAVEKFNIDLSFLAYDLTSFYFEGEYENSEAITYGYSRDKRPDKKQLEVSMNVSLPDGIPITYELLDGNTADVNTVIDNMQRLKELVSDTKKDNEILVVGDRILLTDAIILSYHRNRLSYLGGLASSSKVKELILSVEDSELMASPLDYQPTRHQKADEDNKYYGLLRKITFEHNGISQTDWAMVIYSAGKARLDTQYRQKALEKLLEKLDKIKQKLNTRRYKKATYVLSRIEKAKKGSRAKNLVNVTLTGKDGQLELNISINEVKLQEAKKLDGKYVIATNRQLSPNEMLTLFKQRDYSEKRISVLKGPVRVRPIFLRNDDRIASLVFIIMIALLVYCLIEMQLRQANVKISGQRLLENFAKLSLIESIFNDGSKTFRIAQETPFQRRVLFIFGYTLPQHYFDEKVPI
jgi:transposase